MGKLLLCSPSIRWPWSPHPRSWFRITSAECSIAVAVFVILHLFCCRVCILVLSFLLRCKRHGYSVVCFYLQCTRLGNRHLTPQSRLSLLVYLSVKTSVTQIYLRLSPLSAMSSQSHEKKCDIIVPPALWNSSTPTEQIWVTTDVWDSLYSSFV